MDLFGGATKKRRRGGARDVGGGSAAAAGGASAAGGGCGGGAVDFADLGLAPWVVASCGALGMAVPSAIQRGAIPATLRGDHLADQFAVFGARQRVRVACVTGGVDGVAQGLELASGRPHVVVGTPGRLSGVCERCEVAATLRCAAFLVLDEADRLCRRRSAGVGSVGSCGPRR
ncbi:helicase [Aureococcus anophagefferens]|nr:helicase [Aureococcus anophagefferens]